MRAPEITLPRSSSRRQVSAEGNSLCQNLALTRATASSSLVEGPMLILTLALIAAPKPEPAPKRTVTPDEFQAAKPERKIVMIDVKGWVAEDDKRVRQARALLGRLAKSYDANTHEMVHHVELFWRSLNEADLDSTATHKS